MNTPKSKKSVKSNKPVSSKKAKRFAREAKRAARKGDGSFPDVLVVTKEKSEDGKRMFFYGHKEDLSTLFKDGEVVAVYKLRRVSTVAVSRKVVR